VNEKVSYVREVVSSLITARDNVSRAARWAKQAELSHPDIGKLEKSLMDTTSAWALVLEHYANEG
jgi:hypothetical protein